MSKFITISLLFFSFLMHAQNQKISKIIVDAVAKIPLEQVRIYNDVNNSSSNSEGYFVFIATANQINFSKIGYEDLTETFESLKDKDTVFMTAKSIALNPVLISDARGIVKKAQDLIGENYLLSPYTDRFFLRSILKRNGEIVRLQDIMGKLSSGTTFQTAVGKKTNYKVEVDNMRKVDVTEKNRVEYFKSQSFNEMMALGSTILLEKLDKYNFREIHLNDDNYRKIAFALKVENKFGQTNNGYFIIDKENFAITEVFLDFFSTSSSIPFIEAKQNKYRTTNFAMKIMYAKNTTNNKYYKSDVTFSGNLEFIDKNSIETDYVFLTSYTTVINCVNEEVKPNFRPSQDIFKEKFKYDKLFWQSQNQLPLTRELKEFLKSVELKKEDKKVYNIIGNF